MTPKTSYSSSMSYGGSADSFFFYLLGCDEPDSDETTKDDLLVPYFFGRRLGGQVRSIDQYPTIQAKFTGQLYPQQVEVVRTAQQHLATNGTVLLALHCGFGKTVVAAYLALSLGLKTLVLYHRNLLENQWLETFRGLTEARVAVVGKASDEELDRADVVLCMDTRLIRQTRPLRRSIGCLIVDEAHAFCTPGRVRSLLGTEPRYVILATATPKREDGLESMLEALVGLDRIEKTSDKNFRVYRYNTGIKVPIQSNVQGKADWNQMVNDLCENDDRNLQILKLAQHYADDKILILTWRVSHAKNLVKYFKQLGQSVDYLAGNKSAYHDSRILIGTTSKIGTGFDEKNACSDFGGTRINLLMLVGSTKSLTLLEQLNGRVFRSDFPTVIDFVDDMTIIKRHWSIRKRWYLERNGQLEAMSLEEDRFVTKPERVINRRKGGTGGSTKDQPSNLELAQEMLRNLGL